MKTKEELDAIKAEVDSVTKKLRELSDDEMAQVAGGWNHVEYEVFLRLRDGKDW